MHKFSFYNAPITNIIPSNNLTIRELYDLIISDHYKDTTENYRGILGTQEGRSYKLENFDYVTIAGTFTKRTNEHLEKSSGYFIIDIDHQDHPESIKEFLSKDKELDPLLIFISPGGRGLKVIVEIDPQFVSNDTGKLKLLCQAIDMHFKEKYAGVMYAQKNGNFVDMSGVDIARACFICHDSKCFINPKITNVC